MEEMAKNVSEGKKPTARGGKKKRQVKPFCLDVWFMIELPEGEKNAEQHPYDSLRSEVKNWPVCKQYKWDLWPLGKKACKSVSIPHPKIYGIYGICGIYGIYGIYGQWSMGILPATQPWEPLGTVVRFNLRPATLKSPSLAINLGRRSRRTSSSWCEGLSYVYTYLLQYVYLSIHPSIDLSIYRI